MRLPGTPHECGPLLELGWLSRQLHLGRAIPEGTDTIRVDAIIGTVQRGRDFDGCWHPLHPRLTKLIADIDAAQPAALDEPIEVIRVDRAYFVRDGHKRVALARRTRREFIDAHVSRVSSAYAVDPEIDEQVIFRTAREFEFRRHSGFLEAMRDLRFVLTDIDAYGELFAAVRAHAFEMSEKEGRIVPWPEVARDWYATEYTPVVEEARRGIGALVDSLTDADVFMAIHRQRLAWWGSECDAIECAAQELLVERQLASARDGSLLSGILRRGTPSEPGSRPKVLPLTSDGDREVD